MGLLTAFTIFYVIIAVIIMVATIFIKMKYMITTTPPDDLPNIPQVTDEEKARAIFLVKNDNTNIMGRKQK